MEQLHLLLEAMFVIQTAKNKQTENIAVGCLHDMFITMFR